MAIIRNSTVDRLACLGISTYDSDGYLRPLENIFNDLADVAERGVLMSPEKWQLPNETAITKTILRYLEKIPACFAWKIPGGRYGKSGMPDIQLIREGRATFFEVKVPGETPSDLQKEMMAQLEAAGADCYVVTSKKEVKKIIEGS